MRTKWLAGLGIALTFALVAYLAPGITGASAQSAYSHATKARKGDAPMAAMMSSHRQMMKRLRKEDSSLDALVKKMDASTGQAKVDAEAQLLSTLVLQRKAMLGQMMSMQGQMMERMQGMEGMHSGMMQGKMMNHKSSGGQ